VLVRRHPELDVILKAGDTIDVAGRSILVLLASGRVPEGRRGVDNYEEHPMPRRGTNRWSAKRDRQYEHIKEGLEDSGRSEDEAEEIAARTVNKERARSGEARQVSRTSTKDISSSRRGGLRSHKGPGGRTYRQLYAEAQHKNIEGRSKMTKAQLERAVGR